jgi:hypothetical protein
MLVKCKTLFQYVILLRCSPHDGNAESDHMNHKVSNNKTCSSISWTHPLHNELSQRAEWELTNRNTPCGHLTNENVLRYCDVEPFLQLAWRLLAGPDPSSTFCFLEGHLQPAPRCTDSGSITSKVLVWIQTLSNTMSFLTISRIAPKLLNSKVRNILCPT